MASVVEEAPDEETTPLRAIVEQQRSELQSEFSKQIEEQRSEFAKEIGKMKAAIDSLLDAKATDDHDERMADQPDGDDPDEAAVQGGEACGDGQVETKPSDDDDTYNTPSIKPLSATAAGSDSILVVEEDCPAEQEQPPSMHRSGIQSLSFFLAGAQVFSSKSLPTKSGDAGLPQTIYSVLYVANWKSGAFLYAFSVFILQAGMIVLVLMDQISINTIDRSPFSIPAGVPPQVTAAQATCLFVAVALQDDFIQGVNAFNAGHDPQLPKEQDFEAATKSKFQISATLQLLVGLAQLVATYALVMSSETVIDVFLNFAGLSFVSMVDDAGFAVAAHGYLPRSIQCVCQQTQGAKRRIPRSFWLPQLLSLLAIAGLMAGFGITLHQQLNGYFLCQKLYVQFGDDIRIEYGAFGGEYLIQPDKRYGDRVSYLEVESMKSKSGRSMIAYCSELEAWTHSSWNLTNSELPDPCVRWKARSAGKTAAYDVLETSNAPWVIISDTTGLPGPLDWLYMVCNDCNDATCSPEHGYCSDNDCVCHSGRMGLNCVFEGPCERIIRDANTAHVGGEDFMEHAFSLFRDRAHEVVLYRKHPVYLMIRGENAATPYFLMFMGRRWALLVLINYREEMDFTLLAPDFHAAYDFPYYLDGLHEIGGNLSAAFMLLSEPVDILMRSYSVSPVGLSWESVDAKNFRFTSTLDDRQPSEAVYLCGVCHAETNPRRRDHNYACGWNGVCRCNTGYVGALCEAPISCDVEGFACQNGGICTSVGTCDCELHSVRYFGAFCERDGYHHYEYAQAVQGLHNRTSECGCVTTLQLEYRGMTNEANDGTPCLPWTEIGSALAALWIPRPEDAPELGMEHNYCRNPLMSPYRAYCYTNETNFERCSVPYCPAEICPNMNETCGCIEKRHLAEDGMAISTLHGQQNYRGYINVTRGGRSCLRWDNHPHPVTPEAYPDAGLDENYCRNPTPDDMDGVWCYTDDPNEFYQRCDVPDCPDFTCFEPAFTIFNTFDASYLNIHAP